MAIIWRTSKGEKQYITPSGWPLTKQSHELADELESILLKKISEIKNILINEGYFQMKNELVKHHLLGEKLQFLDDMELLSVCDPDRENIWRALYDYAPEFAPRQLPTDDSRIRGKRNFFLNSYRLGHISIENISKIGTWSNWEDIYMVFAANPRLWEDWERLLNWIIMKSIDSGKIQRKKLRNTLKIFRKILGKKAKIKRDTTVLTNEELLLLLESKYKESK